MATAKVINLKINNATVTKLLKIRYGHGIVGSTNTGPANPKQVLLTDNPKNGNVCVEGLDLKKLESGSLIQIGECLLRITFRKGSDVYAISLNDSKINTGDSIKTFKKMYEEIPYEITLRIMWLLEKIPFGKILTVDDACKTLGLANKDKMAALDIIRNLDVHKYPSFRIIDSDGSLILEPLIQKRYLKNEGIKTRLNKINAKTFKWDISEIFE